MKKVLRKYVALLISVLMVLSSLPLTALGAESALSPNAVGCLCYNESRWSSPNANIVNDGAANNFSMGYVKFDISGLSGKHITNAVYQMVSASTPHNGSTGLSVYWVGNSNMDSIGDNVGTVNTSHAVYTNVINAGSTGNQRLDLVRTYFDLQKIADFDTSQLSSGSRNNINFTAQLNAAIDANKSSFTLMIVQKGTNNRSGDSSPWSDTTIKLEKSNSATISYVDASKNIGTLNNTFYSCICAGNNNRFNSSIQICNDGQAASFSYGLWQYDISSLKSSLENNSAFSSASMTFNITGVNSPVGLDFYYATKNNGNLSSISTTNNPAGGSVSGDENGGRQRSTNAVNNYGGILLKSYPASALSTGSKTLDVSSAVKYAIDNDLNYVTIFALQPKADSTPGASTWTDINISKSAANITYKINGKVPSPYANVTKYVDPNRPANGTTTGQPFIIGVTGGTASQNFRIPSMVTLDDGTIVTAADDRWNTTADGGCNDTVVSISKDNGATWNYSFVNYLGDNGNAFSTSSVGFCDSEIATDGKNIYLLTTVLPAGTGLNSGLTMPSNGAVLTNDGHFWLATSTNGNVGNYDYVLGDFDEDGWAKIYRATDSNGTRGDVASGTYSWNKTSFSYENVIVDENYNIYNTLDNGATYQYQSNLFFKTTIFSVRRTSILMMRKSTDGGQTWEQAKPLPVKDSSEKFIGVGPGRGVVSSDGKFIAFSIYKGDTGLFNTYNGDSERTSIAYSTDGGNTWKRTSALMDGSCSESQLVLLDDNTIRCFFRSDYGTVVYKDAIRNGDTVSWKSGGNVDVTGCTKTSKCQISAIKYSKKIDGKTVLFVSTPSNSGTSRQNGVIYTVFLNDDYTVASTKKYQINTGKFEYSCLTELADGRIADLYEDSNTMTYKAFSVFDLCGSYPEASSDNTDPSTVQQDSFSSVYDSTHSYSSPLSIANTLYIYSENSRNESVISGSFAHGSTYIAINGTAGAFGSTTKTTINIRATNLGSGYDNTFYIYDSSNRAVHFDTTNKKYNRCSSYSVSGHEQNHAMYIYKVNGYTTNGGIKGLYRVSSLNDITDGDQLLFVHPDCDYSSVNSSTTYYCIYPSTSSNLGNHNGKIGNSVLNNTKPTVSASTINEINSLINHGAYTGSATRAADGSYSTSSLKNGDELSGCLWTYGTGPNASYYTRGNNNYWEAQLVVGSATFLYDGTTPMSSMVSCYFWDPSGGWPSYTWYNHKGISTTCTTDSIQLKHYWHGVDIVAGKSGRYVTSTGCYMNYVNSCTLPGTSPTMNFTDKDQYAYFSNAFYINPDSLSDLSTSNTMKQITSTSWTFYVGDNSGNTNTNSNFKGSVTTNGGTTLTILNYKPIKDAIPSIKSFYENNVKGKESYYTTDSLNAYYNAIKAVYFDPNSYFDTSSTNGNNYSGCQTALNSAISQIDIAKGTGLVKRQVKLSFVNKSGVKYYYYNIGDSVTLPKNSSDMIETTSSDETHNVVSYSWNGISAPAVATEDMSYFEQVDHKTPQAHNLSNDYHEASGDMNGYTVSTCSICEYSAIKYDTQDWSAYDAAVIEANDNIANNAKYTAESIGEYSVVINGIIADITSGDETKSETFIKTKTEEILSSASILVLNRYSVMFDYEVPGKPVSSKTFENVEYGTEIALEVPESAGSVYKWTRSIGDKDTGLAENRQSIKIVVTANAKYTAYVADKTTTQENTHVVAVYTKGGRITDILYVKHGESISINNTNGAVTYNGRTVTPIKTPCYKITGYRVGNTDIGTEYTVTHDVNLAPVYSPINAITVAIDNAQNAGNAKFANDTYSYEPNWDEKITIDADSEVVWLVNSVPVAQGTSYTFRATSSITITTMSLSVFTLINAGRNPSGSIITFAGYESSTRKVRVAASTFTNSSRVIKEQGIFVATSNDAGKTFTADEVKAGRNFAATNTTDTLDQFSFTLNVSTTSTVKKFGILSYVIYEGDDTVYYSATPTNVTVE